MSDMIEYPPGTKYKFRNLHFWAQGGLVCFENQVTGEFKALKRPDAAAKVLMFNEELKHTVYPSDRDELLKCVCDLCEAVKEAKTQGDPDNPDVVRERLKSARKPAIITGKEPPPLKQSKLIIP